VDLLQGKVNRLCARKSGDTDRRADARGELGGSVRGGPISRFVVADATAMLCTKGFQSPGLNAITRCFLWEVVVPEGLESSTKGL
jgi:hypothetical protein